MAIRWWWFLLCVGIACGVQRSSSAPERMRVVPDKVMSRSAGFDAELRLPSLRGTGDGKQDRGLSAWMQRGPRRLMGDARKMSEQRPDPSAELWTVRSNYEVTHEGPRYLSVVQTIEIGRGGVPISLVFAATLSRDDPRPVFLPDLLSDSGAGVSVLEAAASGVAPEAWSPMARDQVFYLTTDGIALVFEESIAGSRGDNRRVVVIPKGELQGAWREGRSPWP